MLSAKTIYLCFILYWGGAEILRSVGDLAFMNATKHILRSSRQIERGHENEAYAGLDKVVVSVNPGCRRLEVELIQGYCR